MTAWNPENVRQDFVLLQNTDRVYFDNAATSQKPKCVIDAVQEFYEKYNANVLRGLYPLSVEATERYENARKTVQRFIHAACPEEIIFTRNATESMNLVAYSYGMANLKAGDEILISILEHHSNILPWQMVSRATGAKLVFLECEPDGTIPKEKMDEAFSEHTKLVAVTQVSNVLGCVNDIPELVKRARACGAVILMDAAQSAPHMPIDVQKLDVDFVAFSGHKMLAPMGIGVLYGKQELLEKMPPFLTGGEMIETVSRYDAVYAELPHKFEAGQCRRSRGTGCGNRLSGILRYGHSPCCGAGTDSLSVPRHECHSPCTCAGVTAGGQPYRYRFLYRRSGAPARHQRSAQQRRHGYSCRSPLCTAAARSSGNPFHCPCKPDVL